MAEKAREILKQRCNETKEIQRKRRKEREREGGQINDWIDKIKAIRLSARQMDL